MVKGDLLNELFHPGAPVQMEFVVNKDSIKCYRIRVEDLEHEYLVLRSPIEKGEAISFEEGRELTLWCEKELFNQAYVTNVFVVENRPGDNPLLVCCKPQKIDQTSMRRYFRFSVDLNCSFEFEGHSVEGKVVDISRSGCSIEFDPGLHPSEGSFLEILINFPGDRPLGFTGKVARVAKNGSGKESCFALEIKEITRDMDEVLNNYLFKCQLMNQ
ncbi:MAG: PilZ domain-containing protein [Bacillota bacterium]